MVVRARAREIREEEQGGGRKKARERERKREGGGGRMIAVCKFEYRYFPVLFYPDLHDHFQFAHAERRISVPLCGQ